MRIIFAACLALAAAFSQAQTWPSRPVKLVVPFAAGGATDIPARLLAERLAAVWKQPVVVENRVGAGGVIGTAEVARSSDTHTLLFPSAAVMTINQFVYAKLPYDPEKDLVGITKVVAAPQVLVVNSKSTYTTTKQLIAALKESPGKLTYGHGGNGSQSHLANVYFLRQANVKATGVAYKSDPAALTDLVGGIIDFSMINMAPALGLIKSGKLRALAVTSPDQFPLLPGVPPVAAVLPGFENMSWFGLVAPSSMPAEVVRKVQQDVRAQLQSPEFRGKLEALGYAVVGDSREAMAADMTMERKRWAQLVTDAQIRSE